MLDKIGDAVFTIHGGVIQASIKAISNKIIVSIADVAQLKRHQRWGVGCGCACAVHAPVVTARAHLQLALRRWWHLSCATSAIEWLKVTFQK